MYVEEVKAGNSADTPSNPASDNAQPAEEKVKFHKKYD
jgi:hypothetical protein